MPEQTLLSRDTITAPDMFWKPGSRKTDIDGFHFFFDPYTKAKKILEESFSSGYTESPYLLETAKKRLLFAQEEQKKDAVKCIEGELSALGSTPSLNQTLIKAMTLEEARQAMKAIRESTTGAYCYIGKEQKKKEARIEKAFSSRLPQPSFPYERLGAGCLR
jgi:hypothetical protein